MELWESKRLKKYLRIYVIKYYMNNHKLELKNYAINLKLFEALWVSKYFLIDWRDPSGHSLIFRIIGMSLGYHYIISTVSKITVIRAEKKSHNLWDEWDQPSKFGVILFSANISMILLRIDHEIVCEFFTIIEEFLHLYIYILCSLFALQAY